MNSLIRHGIAVTGVLWLAGCATLDIPADRCPPDTQALPNCPPLYAIDDPKVAEVYDYRTWKKASELKIDPIEFGKSASIEPVSGAVKFLGSSTEDALNSLAAKIWMIENAEHSIDLMYYIYTPDLIGNAVMGALCDAVKRGVDVRFMVDSLGSISLGGTAIKALGSCAVEAGFVRNDAGDTTIRRARIQTVVFNALSKVFINPNRRSHDKLLVIDGFVPEKAVMITGGRNISLSYYGIRADGSHNPDTYNDAELMLRPGKNYQNEEFNVVAKSDVYYTLLFLFKGNKKVTPTRLSDPRYTYTKEKERFRESLIKLKALPSVKKQLDQMPQFFSEGFHDAEVRLAHEFGNLVNKRVVDEAMENLEKNPNSIIRVMREADDLGEIYSGRMVSPYLFMARYKDKDGNIVLDEASRMLEWLEEHPNSTIEIITNSVLTSDNFGAQSVIDMETAPRLLMTAEERELWRQKAADGELSMELINGPEWDRIRSHPRLKIYETGRLDDVLLGGDKDYGKLHAKYLIWDDVGFVGTANFDYRSRLYNNEMGFFFTSPGLALDINADFQALIDTSYLWGSDPWLEMRDRASEMSGMKGWSIRHQRWIYNFLHKTGLQWFF